MSRFIFFLIFFYNAGNGKAIHPQTDEGTYEDWNMPEFEVTVY